MNTAAKTEPKFFLVPAPGRIIVEEDKFKYEGRIVIPDASKRRPTTGRILATGDGVENYHEGQQLVYGLYSGTVINFKNRPAYRILNVDEVLAIVVSDEDFELEGVGV